jgi:phospholipid/cholesterol/gamma-HCH transport system substrate-binding protein
VSRLERLYSPPEIGAPGKRTARSRRRNLVLAGLFVLSMAGATLVTLMVLLPGLLGGVYRLYAYFDDASGLYTSTQVIQEGYAIGIIENMTPLFPGRDGEADRCPRGAEHAGGGPRRSSLLPCFRVTLRIRGDWPIPADSTAVLGSAGMLQGEAIKIQPGSLDVLLQDGQVLASAGRESDLMAQLEALTLSLRNLVDKTIEPALADIRDQVQTIKDLLGTSGEKTENRDRLAGVFQNLKQLSDDIEKVVNPEQLGAILSSVEQVAANLAQVSATFTERSGDVRRTVRTYGDLAKDIRGVVRETRPSLQRSLDDTQFLLQELSASLIPILTNIEDATRNLSALSRDLRSNPAVIIKGREVEKETPWFE